ncbi:hypothetical protein K431DRAFT_164466 [Polychaeton citri CBS 116435]|uniref:SART-1 protein n=1 Tax=Polychaeton citri CBS 116435 TaxID=1314669 RepID=A0A9P4QD72_9PEZI|nr:hypothetical protein K431DRAFT_164466 [Polychaeton citri CBS 116435]
MDPASIEQMNKVRISLGMAPLPVPGANGAPSFKKPENDSSSGEESEDDLSTLEKREAAAGSNWAKLEAEKQEKIDRQKRKEAAKKARDSALRYAKLEGRGLGDEDEQGDVDTRSWLLGQKKRQKRIDKARKLEEQLAEQEREQQLQYTSKDLSGVRVAHEVDEFDDAAGEQILTLKDTEIGDESEDDELENADLKAQEKLRERLELKKRRPDYDPTQDENKGVLSKYDEEIEGKKQKRFTLDGQGSSEAAQRRIQTAEEGDGMRKRVKINLDILKDDAPVSDYVDPSTIKVKKPKKSKKEKKSRRKEIDEDDIPAVSEQPPNDENAMDVDGAKSNDAASSSRKRGLDLDDDDLQFQLSEQRRAALKKRKKTDAAELARQMREEMPIDEAEEEEVDGLVIDETREFVENLKKPDASEPQERERKSRTPQPAAVEDESDDDGDTKMASYADEIRDSRDSASATPAPGDAPTATGLETEDTVSGSGLGSALNLLRKRGIINETSAEKQVSQDRARSSFLASKQSLIDEYDERARRQREAERGTQRWQRMSNRERDDAARKQNEEREKYLSRLLAEQFNKEYKPDVHLRYHDEFGREMNAKDAFKHLSHMFHGKGSGKLKTEKRLKKIEDERKEQGKGVLNVGDEEGGIAGVGGREGKRRGQAGVRLQ